MENTGKVLFVDDEINILKSIKRGFLHAPFEVFTAESAEDGLRILEEKNIDIVVTDYRMPDIDGFQFLKIVKERFPEMNRVILSGFIEKSVAVESLTRGLASTYILKPWLNEDVEEKINHILGMRKVLKSKKLLNVINQIDNLPNLSNIYQEFMDAVNDEKSMDTIAKIIQKDPSISTKVLQVANSAFYGVKHCTSIKQAAITLGLDTLQDILLTISIINTMKWNTDQVTNLQEIFLHAFIMNTHLPQLYRIAPEAHYYKNFPSVGLTYDVGKIILLQYFPDRYASVREHMENHPDQGFYESEKELGFQEVSHQEIGAFFLDYWNLPEIFVETALYHHIPGHSSTQYRDIIDLVHYINTLIYILSRVEDIDRVDPSQLKPHYLSEYTAKETIISIRKKLRKHIFLDMS
jgi:HD-like signal output (HDOD) protein